MVGAETVKRMRHSAQQNVECMTIPVSCVIGTDGRKKSGLGQAEEGLAGVPHALIIVVSKQRTGVFCRCIRSTFFQRWGIW